MGWACPHLDSGPYADLHRHTGDLPARTAATQAHRRYGGGYGDQPVGIAQRDEAARQHAEPVEQQPDADGFGDTPQRNPDGNPVAVAITNGANHAGRHPDAGRDALTVALSATIGPPTVTGGSTGGRKARLRILAVTDGRRAGPDTSIAADQVPDATAAACRAARTSRPAAGWVAAA